MLTEPIYPYDGQCNFICCIVSGFGFTVFINLSTQLVEPGKDCDYKEHGDAMISQDC